MTGRPRPRDPYAEVGAATRAALTAARTAAEPLTRTEWQVLCVLLEATSTWSRLTEHLTVREIAAARYGVDPDDATRAQTNKTTAALRSLAAKGVIVYKPSPRPGGAHRIGLRAATGPGTRPRPHSGRGPRPDSGRGPGSHASYTRDDEDDPRMINNPTPDCDNASPAGDAGVGSGGDRSSPAAQLADRLAAVCVSGGGKARAAVDQVLAGGRSPGDVEAMVAWLEAADQPTRHPHRLLAVAATWEPAVGPAVGGAPALSGAAGCEDCDGTGWVYPTGDGLLDGVVRCGCLNGGRQVTGAGVAGVAGFDSDDLDVDPGVADGLVPADSIPAATPAELPDGFFDDLRARLRGQERPDTPPRSEPHSGPESVPGSYHPTRAGFAAPGGSWRPLVDGEQARPGHRAVVGAAGR